MGNPKKFKTLEDLEWIKTTLDKYFKDCDSNTSPYVTKEGDLIDIPDPKPYTITGMCLALDTDRDTLLQYQKVYLQDLGECESEEERAVIQGISDTIRKSKLKCQSFAEESLWKPKIAQGVIFNLKNNYGWKDVQEQQITGKDGGPIEQKLDVSGADPFQLQQLLSGVDTILAQIGGNGKEGSE